MSEMAQFKLYIKSEFEDRVSKVLDLGVDDDKSVFKQSLSKTVGGRMKKNLLKLYEKR